MRHIAAISWYVFSVPCLMVASEKSEMTSAILCIDPGGVAATFLARSFQKYQMAIRRYCHTRGVSEGIVGILHRVAILEHRLYKAVG